jgi:hypothetical protein
MTTNTDTKSSNPSLDALNRLARIVVKHPGTGQSERIMSFFASLYNGHDFPRVDLSWVSSYMDGDAKRDLAQVFLGCHTEAGFSDYKIREALRAAGVEAAAEQLRRRCKPEVCFLALVGVVDWCLAMSEDPKDKHSADLVRRIILSLTFSPPKGFVPPTLHSLQYVHDDVRDDVLLIIDGAARGYFNGNEGETIESIAGRVDGGTAWLNSQTHG